MDVALYQQQMQSLFMNKQIVWAKVKGYPWWPAEVKYIRQQIAKLPTSDHNVFKVVFIAEDTHAFLNPKDVRKYGEFYDEFSKKKMRGLAPAIQTADQVYKKRVENLPKCSTQCKNAARSPRKGKGKQGVKSKIIKKASTRSNQNRQIQSSDAEEQLQSIAEQQVSQQLNKEKLKVQQQQKIDSEVGENQQDSSSYESLQQEKFMNEGEQKVDRLKIDSIEELIFRYIEEIKQANYKFTIEHYKQISLCNLTDEELLQSKITNMLSFIIHSLKKELNFHDTKEGQKDKEPHLAKEREELRQLISLQKQLKDRIISYLNDTSYYDQYLKLIQRNKKNRNDYENRLIYYLKNSYKIKKELALIFASRLMVEVNNGAIIRERQLLEDIKERRVQISNINNKAAIDRNIENMIPKYM